MASGWLDSMIATWRARQSFGQIDNLRIERNLRLKSEEAHLIVELITPDGEPVTEFFEIESWFQDGNRHIVKCYNLRPGPTQIVMLQFDHDTWSSMKVE